MDLSALEQLLLLLRKHDVTSYTSPDGLHVDLGVAFTERLTSVNDLADKEKRQQVIVDELKKHLKDDDDLEMWST